MARTDTTRLVLLGLLDHGPATGYDLRRLIDVRLSAFWKAGFAQIYPALAGLEGEGLVTASVERSAKGQPKKVFEITEAGRRALESTLREYAPRLELRADFLLKVFFGARAPREQVLSLLRELGAHHRGALRHFALYEQQLEAPAAAGEREDHRFYLQALRLGQKLSLAMAEWAESAGAALRTEAPSVPAAAPRKRSRRPSARS